MLGTPPSIYNLSHIKNIMDKLLRTATALGTSAVVAGVAAEFFIYDGKKQTFFVGVVVNLHCSGRWK